MELSRRIQSDDSGSDLINIAERAIDSDNLQGLEALPDLISELEEKMKLLASNLDFEEAAKLRDRIHRLRKKMTGR